MSILPLGAATAVTQCGLHLWCGWPCELASVPVKGLDTTIATRIAAGDTIIKVVDLLCRCVDESGNTQALYCMDKDVLVDVQHHAWTRVGFTLLCTVMREEPCGLSRGEKCLEFNPVTVCLGHSSIWILLETPWTSCSVR